MEDKESCPLCGGFADGIPQHSDLEAESAPEVDYASDTERGNEDQDAARKARLDGIMSGIRKRQSGK